MKEYKFRGKRIDNGKWVYGYYVKTQHSSLPPEFKAWEIHWIIDVYNIPHQVYPETVGLYLTLKDNNGKEIYEEDIVKGTAVDGTERIGVIRYIPPFNLLGVELIEEKTIIPAVNFFNLIVEVIGNIYDNPELLGKEET